MNAPSPYRLRWPLLVLMASIGLTAFAAFDAQRTVRGQNAVVDGAIRELSSFAAWSYGEHLKQQLTISAAEVIGAVNHGGDMHTNPRVPDAEDLVHYLPDDVSCDCHRTRRGPNPASFFGFKLGTHDVDVARNYFAMANEGWRVDPAPGMPVPPSNLYSAAERKWLSDMLSVHARAGSRDDYGFGLVVGHFEGRIRPVSYTLMPTAWGDTIVYGVEYTLQAFAATLERVLDGQGLLPQTFTQGMRNRDIVAVQVLTQDDLPIYESAPGVRSQAATRLALAPAFGSLALNVMIRPEQARGIIIGGIPRSRLPFTLGLLGVAAALTLVAFMQIRRETDLARMRSDFVASISHELRTPLAQIKLYVETLRLGRAETAAKREWSLAHVDRETSRLANLVENVLRFSRLGRAEERASEPIAIGPEIERLVEEFMPLAASRKTSIAAEIAASPLVRIRPDALRHIIVNLLDNAVKYGPQSQTVTVAVQHAEGKAIVSVSDQGMGVDPSEREAIWSAFARGRVSPEEAGSGIGLTIVRDLVRQNAGEAWVEDADGGGARFVVVFPSVGAAGGPTTEEAAREHASAT